MAQPTLGNTNKANFNAITGSIAITTVNADELLLIFISTVSAAASVVASLPGLLWTNRTKLTNASSARLEVWYAPAPDIGTYTVSVTLGSSVPCELIVIAVRNADLVNPFDPSAGLPFSQASSGTAPTATITNLVISDVNAMIIGALTAALQNGTLTAGATYAVAQTGGTNIGAADATGGVETKQPAGGTNNITVNGTISVSSTYIWYADAIQAEAAPQENTPGTMGLLRVGCYAAATAVLSAAAWIGSHLRFPWP